MGDSSSDSEDGYNNQSPANNSNFPDMPSEVVEQNDELKENDTLAPLPGTYTNGFSKDSNELGQAIIPDKSPEFSSASTSSSPTMTKVCQLVMWRDPVTSGLVCGSLLFVFFSLSIFSVISVLSYTGLGLLGLSLGARVYVQFIGSPDSLPAAVRGPLKAWIQCSSDAQNAFDEEKVNDYLERGRRHLKEWSVQLWALVTVKDYTQSAKFAALLYLLTFIGAWFNFLTLCILGTILAFVCPPLYEMNSANIDNIVAIAKQHTRVYVGQITEAVKSLPVFGKKTKEN
jgi:hypothetical protein